MMTNEEFDDTMWDVSRSWKSNGRPLKRTGVSGKNKSQTMTIDRHGCGGADRMGLKSIKNIILYTFYKSRVSDSGERYVDETQRVAQLQHL
jgi:hypothetical protein